MAEARKQLLVIQHLVETGEEDWNSVRELITVTWQQLGNLGTMYEDLIREWFLPKTMGMMLRILLN